MLNAELKKLDNLYVFLQSSINECLCMPVTILETQYEDTNPAFRDLTSLAGQNKHGENMYIVNVCLVW